MSYEVEVTRYAERDLADAVAFISQDSADAAGAWLKLLNRRIATLKRYPFRCKRAAEAQPDEEIRQLVVGRYRVIFLVDEKSVVLLALRSNERLPLHRGELKRRRKIR